VLTSERGGPARLWDPDEGSELRSLGAEGLELLTRLIARAANQMNGALEMRYRLSDLAGNPWCRDCNAVIAVYLLATRRGNPAPVHLTTQYENSLRELAEIRRGRMKVPQAAESLDSVPQVTNFNVNLKAGQVGLDTRRNA
jgi:hypothetical protein